MNEGAHLGPAIDLYLDRHVGEIVPTAQPRAKLVRSGILTVRDLLKFSATDLFSYDLIAARAVFAELEQRAENPNPAPYVMPAELRLTAVQSIARIT